MAANQKDAVDKTAKPTKKEVPELDPAKDYVIIGTGEGKHLKDGVEYPVSGADAAALIANGHATLKADK